MVILEIVAKPLLLLRQKNPPPGPPKPSDNLVRVENPTRATLGDAFIPVQGLYLFLNVDNVRLSNNSSLGAGIYCF